jgi:hypothetical protein
VARFDWYQATVRAHPQVVIDCLRGLSASAVQEDCQKVPHGYGAGVRLLDADGLVAQVWWGGTHTHPHAVLTGEMAAPGAELLRTHLADHSVTRADVCIDYAEPGAYDRLQGIALSVARERGVKVGTAGDHLVTMKGRTCYLGAPSSHTRLRLYDKAEELRQKFQNDLHRLLKVPDELARLECQVRPQTPQAKHAAATVEPMALMGSAAWMRELMRQVSGTELQPFLAGQVWRQADDDRAYAAVLAQYGGMFKRLASDLGGWDVLGLQLRDDLAQREADQHRIKGRR